jgi:hypothetical protein
LSLPVLADPFWGRLPWLLKRRGGKHSKHRKSASPLVAPVCALGPFLDSIYGLDFNDI